MSPPVTADQDEPGGPPRIIRIPDPVGVRQLASAMNVKCYEVIRDLMAFEVCATPESKLDFATASRVCAQHDIVARPTI
jgi:translation initiation factor IF-2